MSCDRENVKSWAVEVDRADQWTGSFVTKTRSQIKVIDTFWYLFHNMFYGGFWLKVWNTGLASFDAGAQKEGLWLQNFLGIRLGEHRDCNIWRQIFRIDSTPENINKQIGWDKSFPWSRGKCKISGPYDAWIHYLKFPNRTTNDCF